MVTPTYICDLEGTTGIYSTGLRGEHVNDVALLRSGFRSIVNAHNRGDVKLVIASRVPRHFMNDIQKNLRERGVDLKCPVYTKEDIQLDDEAMPSYKDYRKIYQEQGIVNPSKDAVVIGDFLRFPHILG